MQSTSVISAEEHRQTVRAMLDRLRRELLQQRTAQGYWEGELSASALSTATAISALSTLLRSEEWRSEQDASDDRRIGDAIARGMQYLCRSQNEDGGFGDTDRSHSNIATSYLALAAATLSAQARGAEMRAEQRQRLHAYIEASGGTAALRARYGKDKTFVVPILTNLAIAGLVPWQQVAPLPFEAAVFPQSMYRLLRMPVVSYAIPALVAIGQARHINAPSRWWPARAIRAASVSRTMNVLRRMQPDSGGYLEATPLTSFVVMSLAASGRSNHDVTRQGVKFLMDSMREDGSWPIDTNLATWVTSLSIHALDCDPDDRGEWCTPQLMDWHLECQHRKRHPFTGASPGGWGWTDLSGAVPDSDDTPAAILALRCCQRHVDDDDLMTRSEEAIQSGLRWLGGLQNRDGGWPTFCRGWGKLPFDRSSNDLTAHALRAIFSSDSHRPASQAINWQNGVRFLHANQQADGSWLPLWFGNQDREHEDNPVYGTARVLATAELGLLDTEAVQRGVQYLVGHQNQDGGWGGGPSVTQWLQKSSGATPASRGGEPDPSRVTSSVEETALAVDALCTVLLSTAMPSTARPSGDQNLRSRNPSGVSGVESDSVGDFSRGNEADPAEIDAAAFPENNDSSRSEPTASYAGGKEALEQAIIRGVEFLLGCVQADRHRLAWPIGFYFAKLWYHERLYPLIFTTAALGKYLQWMSHRSDPTPSHATAAPHSR